MLSRASKSSLPWYAPHQHSAEVFNLTAGLSGKFCRRITSFGTLRALRAKSARGEVSKLHFDALILAMTMLGVSPPLSSPTTSLLVKGAETVCSSRDFSADACLPGAPRPSWACPSVEIGGDAGAATLEPLL